ncbi:hypothetical protein H1P_2640010 [Hyella patelloides LEGE 07179]|uniref:Uncharacterized protein n=1 Tax=Hyella patelloides LEGE 07179 TaxID=945734 RepID=A0A563VRN3_9CYAN|nr:hypothetical protein H1P_230001 [Hyella patelloides LEGE 07179]VEP14440.1 hypothetical protein H1P_2640010 [Hyella patelloides LEGE 07179]
MPGKFEGLNDLEWKLFQDIFPKKKNSEKRSRSARLRLIARNADHTL